MGDRFTSADILLMTCLTGRSPTGSASATTPSPYLDRIRQREAYKQANVANKPLAPITPVQAKG